LVQEPLEVAGMGQRGWVPPPDRFARPALTPAAATGASAVQQAKRDQVRREAVSADELEAANEEMLMIGHVGQARHVSGRLFKEIEGVWTDLMHSDSTQTVRIEQFSEAYFAVLDALPELEAYVSEFEAVIVAGERLSIQFGDAGASTVSARGLRRLVREFRGQ
jgi:hypothetical protein